ncbi:pyridoxamine 5'-phosphate oxidase family protein [Sphaerisporangium sp. TRM90804]|uniref:pyridoxamine 5'-phosphate oxidase family protein n=1 Tax=Sphaerisporangium sp. TRM90804 TaxID=3031113 RepID=UPI002446F6EE|nr:pyridoxamine 5'-phosphate oxidase family protein [Sphaerisporangium sp. TRM90804]MDH2430342.1 pyridoxamine 5'-phosphate oxidase family protein [Sphaerisporangium sp. TRM90804]
MSLSNGEPESPPQGDVRLLDTPVARRLLAAPLVARLAYTGKDGTPRLIPVDFLWTGDELVVGAFAGTYKIRDLRARPDVAVTIDTADGPPQVLMLRGRVTLAEADGVLPEYAAMQRRGMGERAATAYLEAIDRPGLRMVRIGLRPAWVGVLDFQRRFPSRTPQPVLAALGGGR